MPFSRRRSSNFLRPIHSIKHIIDNQGGQVLNVKSNIVLAKGVDAPTVATPIEVETGAYVKSIFLNVQIVGIGASEVLGNIYMIIYKNPQNQIPVAAIPNANATSVNSFKRMIFHTEMAMLGNTNTEIPITLFKGVLKIPKHMQNMRVDDEIELQLFSPTVSHNFCVQCIYKSYR